MKETAQEPAPQTTLVSCQWFLPCKGCLLWRSGMGSPFPKIDSNQISINEFLPGHTQGKSLFHAAEHRVTDAGHRGDSITKHF